MSDFQIGQTVPLNGAGAFGSVIEIDEHSLTCDGIHTMLGGKKFFMLNYSHISISKERCSELIANLKSKGAL